MANAVELDLDLLNELFDNQKMLEKESLSNDFLLDNQNNSFEGLDIDDQFLESSLSFSDPTLGINNQNNAMGVVDFTSDDDLMLSFDDDLFEQKSRSMTTLVVPVVMEIIVISCGLIYFS